MTTATPSAGKRIAHAHYQRSGGQTFPDGKGALANDIDTAIRDSQKKLVEALEIAETEMRYAGWTELDDENVGRKSAYDMVCATLAKAHSGQGDVCS